MLKPSASWLWLLYLIPLSSALPARNDAAAVVSIPAASTATPVPELLKPRQVAFTQETRTITGWILRFATASVTAATIVTVRSTDIAVKTSFETFTAAAQSTSTVATTTITKTVTGPAAGARSATEVSAAPVGGAPRLNARQATTITTYVSTVDVTEYTTTTSFVTIATVTSTDLELFTSSSTATQIWLDTSLLKLVTATETVTATAAPGAGQSAAGSGGGLSTGAQIGLGVAVGVLALILLAIGAWFLIRRRRKRRAAAVSSFQQSPHANEGDKAAGSQPPGSPWTVDSQARPPSELHSQSTGTAAPRVWSGQSWSTATAVGGGWGDQRESVHGFQQQIPHDGQWHPSVREASPPMSENGFVARGGTGHWHNGHGGHDGVQGPAELVDQPKLHELSAK